MADVTNIFDIQIEEPKTNINEYTWSFYGDAGFGKSSLCTVLFDDPMFFQWEKGQNALRAKKWRAPDWKTFGADIKMLQMGVKAGKTIPFKTPIMDTVDIAFGCCKDKVCVDNGWTHPSEGEWGKGWDAVREEFEFKMKNLEDLGLSPVYVSHVKDKEVKPKRGDKYDKIMPSVPNSASETVIGKVDFVGYCIFEKIADSDNKEQIVRRIYFRSNGEFEAKARLLFFPDFVEYGNSPEEAAYNIRKAFDEAVFKEFNMKVDNAGKLPFASKFSVAAETTKPKTTKAATTKTEQKETKKEVAEKVVENNTVQQDAPVKEETEKTPIIGNADSSTNTDIDKLIDEAQTLFTDLLKEKRISAQDIVGTLKEYVGCSKFGQIKEVASIEQVNNLIAYAKTL